MSEIDYAARVQRGAALLDEKWPTWAQDIDLDTLDVGNGTCCVTAQCYLASLDPDDRDYGDEDNWKGGMELLALTDGECGTYVAHGFNGEYGRDEDGDVTDVPKSTFAILNRLWRDLIIQRREAAQPPEASER